MIRSRSILFAGTALVAAATLHAQDAPARSRVRGPGVVRSIDIVRRPRLGVVLATQAQQTDSVGAYVEAVTPGGPAAKAGLKSGDIITKIDGSALVDDAAPSDDDRSPPAVRLIERVAKLAPGDTVKVEYLRGGDRRTVSVVTTRAVGPQMTMRMRTDDGDSVFRFDDGQGDTRMRMPMPPGMSMERSFGGGGDERMFTLRFDGPLGDLELAPMNADLGQYFGTTEGVLVLAAPKDGALGLKGGDVVLGVDGRKASGPGSLLRILRSYDGGESFKLEVMRNKKKETVTGTLSERTRSPNRRERTNRNDD